MAVDEISSLFILLMLNLPVAVDPADAESRSQHADFDLYLYVKNRISEIVRERNSPLRKRKCDENDMVVEDIILYGLKGQAQEQISITFGVRTRDRKEGSTEQENRRITYDVLANLYHEKPVRLWEETKGRFLKNDVFIRVVDLVVDMYFSDILEICKQSGCSGKFRGLAFIKSSTSPPRLTRQLPIGESGQAERVSAAKYLAVSNERDRLDRLPIIHSPSSLTPPPPATTYTLQPQSEVDRSPGGIDSLTIQEALALHGDKELLDDLQIFPEDGDVFQSISDIFGATKDDSYSAVVSQSHLETGNGNENALSETIQGGSANIVIPLNNGESGIAAAAEYDANDTTRSPTHSAAEF